MTRVAGLRPTSFVQPKNARLYDRHGFGLIRRTLRPGGKVAFWSKRAAHVIYVASLAVRE